MNEKKTKQFHKNLDKYTKELEPEINKLEKRSFPVKTGNMELRSSYSKNLDQGVQITECTIKLTGNEWDSEFKKSGLSSDQIEAVKEIITSHVRAEMISCLNGAMKDFNQAMAHEMKKAGSKINPQGKFNGVK